MDTSLKLFSEAFDVTPEEMYILMLSDKEFFKEPLKIKMNYGEIRLNRELMDKLENLYYEKKDSVEVPILEVAQVLRTTEKELNSIMGKYPNDFKRMRCLHHSGKKSRQKRGWTPFPYYLMFGIFTSWIWEIRRKRAEA